MSTAGCSSQLLHLAAICTGLDGTCSADSGRGSTGGPSADGSGDASDEPARDIELDAAAAAEGVGAGAGAGVGAGAGAGVAVAVAPGTCSAPEPVGRLGMPKCCSMGMR